MAEFSGARLAAAVAIVTFSLVLSADPAVAAKAPAHTTISAHLSASTVLVRSTAAVSGTVSPAGGSVVLERLVATTWQPIAHQKPSRTGAYAFAVRAPKSAATWSLKVVRAASSTAKAATSATLHLRVVTKQFVVAAASPATVTAPTASVVTGVVVPAVGGTVLLQRLQGGTWIAAATGRIGAGGAFSVSTALPVGTQRLRVVKPYTKAIAQGTSRTLTVAVAAPTVLAVTTTALPAARVGVPFAAELTASGGDGFYQWSGTGLPAGLTLSPAGLLAGIPVTQGTTAFTVTVTDGAGRSAVSSLSLTSAAPAGRLFAVGRNDLGQIGNGTTAVDAHTIVPVAGMTSVTSASTGPSTSLAVKADGTVWAWGDNGAGEFGNGTTTGSPVPLQIASLSGVTAVASGAVTSYALKSDGTVWAWGGSLDGEVGDGSTGTERLTPVQVSGLSSIVAIAATDSAGYALRSDGTVWAWGDNFYGQVGDGTRNNRAIPVQVVGLTGIKQIASGSNSGYALRSDGTVAAWGSDGFGELGDGAAIALSSSPVTIAGLSHVTQIAGGLASAYALTASGTVVGWGENATSELGGGTASNPSTPVAITTDALGIAAGYRTGYALLADHSVVAWGQNVYGQLGNGSTTTGATPAPMSGVSGVLSVTAGGFSSDALLIAG